jgi:UDP-N-acetylmuramoylalanine--D-glutamate ligase
MLELNGKTILILGAGKSGISAAKFLLNMKTEKIILSDSKPKTKLDQEAVELEKSGVVLETDGHKDASFLEADIIIISPGVPILPKWREVAARNSKLLMGDVEFASQFTDAKIVAITGTNGKTTVTTLIYEILKAQMGDKVELAGNIGIPFCDMLREGKKPEYIVLEISSFQLEAIRDFRPFVSIILNVTEDHQDRYSGMQEYAMVKANIFRNQTIDDFLILNAEDKFTNIMVSMAKPAKFYFSAYREIDNGIYFKDGSFVKNMNGKKEELFKASDIKLIGKHNYENILACVITADLLKLDMAKAVTTIENFNGLHHRIEFASEVNGVKYYDDSKGTNVDAVIKAIDTFTDDMVLILGGREKGTDFSPLYNILPKNVKLIVALGENREKIKGIFSPKIEVLTSESMEDTVNKCVNAKGVKVVLLSPGCASFDLFKGYAHRGDEFKKYVLKAASK